MKIAVIIARVLLGLVFTVFGLNGFFGFIEVPPFEGLAGDFMTALFSSGYLYVVKVIEVVGGLILLSGKMTPLGLVLLGPIIVNILLFHVFLAKGGYPLPILVVLLEGFLIWAYRDSFKGVLALK